MDASLSQPLWAGAGLLLRERDRVVVLRLVRERSASLLDDEDELEDDELLLLELDRDPELLRDELLSEELPLLSLLLELRFLRSFSLPRCFLSALSDSSESDRFFDRVIGTNRCSIYRRILSQTNGRRLTSKP